MRHARHTEILKINIIIHIYANKIEILVRNITTMSISKYLRNNIVQDQ